MNLVEPYTVLCSSCDRDDLLAQTVDSFFEHVDIPPQEFVIINDGPERPAPDCLQHRNIRWLCTGKRAGQILVCDKLWRECKTEFAFWLEEDWAFLKTGFIQQSFDILKANTKIFTVSLRADQCNTHPMEHDDKFPGLWLQQHWHGFGSFNFNPGLRRRSDYLNLGSTYEQIGGNVKGSRPERFISLTHQALGYRIAALPDLYIEHIGGAHSRSREPF